MKKIITIIATLLLSLNSFSQLEVVSNQYRDIYESIDFKLSTSIINDDTTYFVTYKNNEYEYLVQFESILFNNKEEVYQFVDLSNSVEEERIQTTAYSISKFGKAKVFIYVNKKGYFTAKKQDMLKMKEALNNF